MRKPSSPAISIRSAVSYRVRARSLFSMAEFSLALRQRVDTHRSPDPKIRAANCRVASLGLEDDAENPLRQGCLVYLRSSAFICGQCSWGCSWRKISKNDWPQINADERR